ncbi:MAG: hypothetical protein ACREDL_17255 [Bradyrhizobium sp.]
MARRFAATPSWADAKSFTERFAEKVLAPFGAKDGEAGLYRPIISVWRLLADRQPASQSG